MYEPLRHVKDRSESLLQIEIRLKLRRLTSMILLVSSVRLMHRRSKCSVIVTRSPRCDLNAAFTHVRKQGTDLAEQPNLHVVFIADTKH